MAEAERGVFWVMQQSISFGDSSGKVAAAAAAAQRAMQEQELAELVSLGFNEADAKVGFRPWTWGASLGVNETGAKVWAAPDPGLSKSAKLVQHAS